MKYSITVIIGFLFMGTLVGQILVRNENWPNTNWTVSGTYTPQALVSNPTLNTSFNYDTSLVIPEGALSTLSVVSPYFSLQPAFDGGEKILKISFNVAYTSYVNDVLFFQYWNADSNSWINFPEGSAPIAKLGDFKTCTFNLEESFVDGYLDFSSFSSNQMQNFRYRFFVNGTNNQVAGVCINSVNIISLSCIEPTNLRLIDVTSSQASISWDNENVDLQFWEVQYGFDGFVLGTGIILQTNESVPLTPFKISGLLSNTKYQVYVRKDCDGFYGYIQSAWVGPLNFTTNSLGLNEFKLEELQLFPNPTHDNIEINSLDIVNEIKLYDLNGRELINLKIKNNNIKVDLSTMNNGLYLLKIETDKGSKIYKVVKD